jgi:protein-disulfide isomerase
MFMSPMFRIFFIILLAMAASTAFAQQPAILATSSLRAFTVADLSPETRTAWEQRDRSLASAREQLLSQMVSEELISLEAKAARTTSAVLIDKVRKRIADPVDDEIKRTYETNAQALGNKPLSEARTTIVSFLRREPEERALKAYVEDLAAKYRVGYATDINSPGLKPTDVLFTIGEQSYTAQKFESRFKLAIYDLRADLADDVEADLTDTIFTALVEKESTLLKIDQQTYLAREVTDKLKTFTDDERSEVVRGLKDRLFLKYRVKFLIEQPTPVVQKISVDDDPARGPANAPVTVVMFADYQCPACSRTHPVLQKVLGEFPGKVRFVARDYPLESIHDNAFRAALAAGAANAQGKFFEYGELLYKNQDALDDGSLKKYAAQLGLNTKQFEQDMNSERMAAEIRKDVADGESYGINGTPTIFVNGVAVRRLAADEFRKAINSALRSASRATNRVAPR